MINVYSILIGNLIAVIVLAILARNLPFSFHGRSAQEKIFYLIMIPIAAGAVFGIGSALFDGMPGSVARVFVYICGTAGVIFPVVVGFGLLVFVETTIAGRFLAVKKKITLMGIPIALIIILGIVNLFIPFIFQVTPDNHYQRGSLGLIALIPGFAYMAYAIIMMTYIKFKNKGFLFVSLPGFVIPVVSASLLQALFYGAYQSWIGLSIGMVTMYTGLYRDMLYTDAMTQAYNRNYLNYILQRSRSKRTALGGIAIDIDRFKSINDTYGHLEGDRALKRAVDVFRCAGDDRSIVLRIGGDEFLFLRPQTDEEGLEGFIDRIRQEGSILNASIKGPYDLEFSMGKAVFIPGETSREEWETLMDRRMYEDKRARSLERRGMRVL